MSSTTSLRKLEIFILLIVAGISLQGVKVHAQHQPDSTNCKQLQEVVAGLSASQQEIYSSWLRFYRIKDTTGAFLMPRKGHVENQVIDTFDPDEVDMRSIALSPGKAKGLSYEGYFIDLSRQDSSEIGFDDSHTIELYDFNRKYIKRILLRDLQKVPMSSFGWMRCVLCCWEQAIRERLISGHLMYS